MGYNMKNNIHSMLGIDEVLSTYDTPVFMKKLDGGVVAEANKDGTVFMDTSVPEKDRKDVLAHEMVHKNQMLRGELQYNNEDVIWKGKTYSRESMNEGAASLPWEKEAYNKTNK
jgi:hypothetical protein